ncbi:MAG TPA: lysophospholipid acyltransferase family protein, partial [Steroidobacteraceae bacterium]|nr:lysophospholipid acyltransferase family protein [Steroidobacteraceae bacterium]
MPTRAPLLRAVAQTAYTLYALCVFCACGLAALLLVVVLPGVRRRRAATRALARALFGLAGMRLRLRGMEHLPAGQCVIVANHASYLDGLVFTAVLPPRFGFVIKREMAQVPLAGSLLRRIGSEFVERFNRHKGAADARRVVRNAVNGESLVFFPEGTFSARPGLAKFHAGAFITATRAGCPIVPAVVRGTRRALPPGRLRPWPAVITVTLLAPLPTHADDSARETAVLRERARAAILGQLEEPDLAAA